MFSNISILDVLEKSIERSRVNDCREVRKVSTRKTPEKMEEKKRMKRVNQSH